MATEIEELKRKIEVAKMKKQELLVELNNLKTRVSEDRRWEDLKKIEELKKQLLNNA